MGRCLWKLPLVSSYFRRMSTNVENTDLLVYKLDVPSLRKLSMFRMSLLSMGQTAIYVICLSTSTLPAERRMVRDGSGVYI